LVPVNKSPGANDWLSDLDPSLLSLLSPTDLLSIYKLVKQGLTPAQIAATLAYKISKYKIEKVLASIGDNYYDLTSSPYSYLYLKLNVAKCQKKRCGFLNLCWAWNFVELKDKSYYYRCSNKYYKTDDYDSLPEKDVIDCDIEFTEKYLGPIMGPTPDDFPAIDEEDVKKWSFF